MFHRHARDTFTDSQNNRQHGGSVCRKAGKQVVSKVEHQHQHDYGRVRREAFQVRAHGVGEPVDEA